MFFSPLFRRRFGRPPTALSKMTSGYLTVTRPGRGVEGGCRDRFRTVIALELVQFAHQPQFAHQLPLPRGGSATSNKTAAAFRRYWDMLLDAIRQGDADQVRTLLARDPALANSRTPEGATPVLWAVYTRHAELAPLLLMGRPADFFEACALGDTARAAELLTADPGLANRHSGDGFTGLGYACFFAHAELARLLLDAGADPNLAARNALGVAPLHSAVTTGMPALVELLLSRGADPNPEEGNGMTPLHSAAGHGNRPIVALLLGGGATPAHKARDGRTPADIARHHGHPEVAAELEG